MNDWKYCPHCGKELAAGAPKPQDAAPIVPWYPQPYPWTQPAIPWGPIITWTTSATPPLMKDDNHKTSA